MKEKLSSGIEKGYLYWSYPSWTEHYGYYCENRAKRVTWKVTILIFSTFICLALLYLCDILGRKKIILISSGVIIIGILMSSGAVNWLFGNSLELKMIGIGLAGGAEGAFSALFNLIINESTCKFILFEFIW